MYAVLQVLRHRVARSIMPLSPSEHEALLKSASYLSVEDRERLALEVLALGMRTQRRWGRRTEPLYEQLIAVSDQLLGAFEAA